MKGLLKGLIILLVIIALIAIAGAYLMQGPAVPPNATNNTTGPSAGYPAVSILSPSDDAVIIGNNVTVRVNSSNINIPSDGLFHVFFNSNETIGTGPVFTFSNVSPGNHEIRAEIKRPDNTSFFPPVSESITITVVGNGNVTNQTNMTPIMNISNATNVTNATQANTSESNMSNATNNTSATSGYS